MKDKYRNASILRGGRVVFKIKGNEYRLVTKIGYEHRVVYIRCVGTHREYDAIDANFRDIWKVSEVLNHRRPLSIQMIRRLHSVYDIPAEALIKQDSLEEQGTSMRRTCRVSSTGGVGTAAKRKAAKNKKTITKKTSVGKRKSAQRD